MTEHESHTPQGHGGPGHDRVTISPAGVIAAGVGLLALTGFAMLLVARLPLFFEKDRLDERDRAPSERAASRTAETDIPPPPRVQPNQELQRQRQRHEKLRVLASYGWVDASEGIARIPIERAMDVVAERGLNPWTSTGAAQNPAPPTPEQPQTEGDDATN